MARIGSVYVNLQVDVGQMSRFRTAAMEVETSSRRMRTALGSTTASVHALRSQMSMPYRARLFGDSLRTITRTNDEVQRLRASMVMLAAITGTGFTGALSAAYLLQTADRARLLSNQLKTVTESTADLKNIEQQLYDVSQRTRSSFDATTKIYARTARATEFLGMKQHDLLRITETVQKAFAIGGATQAEATGAAIQLSQGIASDRFSGEEFRSVAENAPVLLQGMARSLGVNIGKLREMAHAGQLTAEVVTKAILEASQEIDDQFGKTVSTVGQGFTRIDNAFLRYIGNVDESYGLTTKLATGMANLAENFEDVAYWIDKAAVAGLAWAGARGLSSMTRSPFAAFSGGMGIAMREVEDAKRAAEEQVALRKMAADAIRDQEAAVVNAAARNAALVQMDRERNKLLAERSLHVRRLDDLEARQVVAQMKSEKSARIRAKYAKELADIEKRSAAGMTQGDKVVAATFRASEDYKKSLADLARDEKAYQELQKKSAASSATVAAGIRKQEAAVVDAAMAYRGLRSDRSAMDAVRKADSERMKKLVEDQARVRERMEERLDKKRQEVARRAGKDVSGLSSEQTNRAIAAYNKSRRDLNKLERESVRLAEQHKAAVSELNAAAAKRYSEAGAKNFDRVAASYEKQVAAAAKLRSLEADAANLTKKQQDALDQAAKKVEMRRRAVVSAAIAERETLAAATRHANTISDQGEKAKALATIKERTLAVDQRISATLKDVNNAVDVQRQRVADIDKRLRSVSVSEKKREAMANSLAREQRRLVALQDESVAIQKAHVDATQRIDRAQRAATRSAVAMNMARRAGSSVLGFFGGWTGVAFMAAITGMALYARHSAKAAEEVSRITEQLENMGYLTKGAADEMIRFQKSVADGKIAELQVQIQDMDKYIAGRQKEIADLSLSRFDPRQDPKFAGDLESLDFQKAFSEYKRLVAVFREGKQEIAESGELSDEMRKKIEGIALANPEMASVIRQFVILADKIKAALGALTDFRQGLTETAARGSIETPAWVKDAMWQEKYMEGAKFGAEYNRLESLSDFDKEIQKRTESIMEAAEKAGKTISEVQAKYFARQGALTDIAKKGGLRDLIGFAEGTDKGRGYNETLDYGRWTGGDVNLVGMTLKEIVKLQGKMLANPENRALYGNGEGSSALGRYQITRRTLLDMMEKMGLSGDEYFNSSMQDRIADQLIRQRGRSAGNLRNEWEGLKGIDSDIILQAFDTSSQGMAGMDEGVRNQIELKEKHKETIYELIQAIKDETSAKEIEIALMGKSDEERIYALKVLEEENKLRREGIEITDEHRARIEQEAAAYAKVSVALDQAKEKQREYQQNQQDAIEATNEFGSELGGLFREIANGSVDWVDVAIKALGIFISYLNKINIDNQGSGIFGGGFLQSLVFGFLGLKSAKGNVFDSSGVVPFKDGGVIGQPTTFPYKGGMGLMGEAGPEAIMPLMRGPDGALGVKVHGGPGVRPDAGEKAVNINVNVAGARGNAEIRQMVQEGVAQGLTEYDRNALPGRVSQVSNHPRVRG